MPYEGEIEVNNLPLGTTPNQADKIMLIDHETGELKQFGVASLSTVVSDVSFTNEAKNALIDVLSKVAYLSDASDSLEYLADMLHTASVDHIVAVFTQGDNIVYNTDKLYKLKDYLVVAAYYVDGSYNILPNYAYNLSGTLTPGTSTVTVSYMLETTTFTVNVTTGFKYDYRDGTLIEQSYITKSGTGVLTESIVDNTLRLYGAKSSSNTASNSYSFMPATISSGERATFKIKFKINDIGYLTSSNTTSYGLFSFILSDGTDAAPYGFLRYNNSSGNLKDRIASSSVAWGIDVSLETWHTAEIIYDTTNFTVKLDGTIRINNAAAPSSWVDTNRILIYQTNSNVTDIYIEEMEFRVEEVS